MSRIVYLLTNKINNKIYIGQTNGCLEERWRGHYNGTDRTIDKAIRKYGKRNFKRRVLQYCDTQEELNKAEKKWITQLKAQSVKVGYNIQNGGKGGGKHTEATKEKMRRAKLGKKHSQETRNKISKNHVGFRGKKHSQQTRNKISKKNKEYCRTHTPSMKGKKHSQETRNKISKKNKQYWKVHTHPSGMKGKKHTEESKNKIRKKLKEYFLSKGAHNVRKTIRHP